MKIFTTCFIRYVYSFILTCVLSATDLTAGPEYPRETQLCLHGTQRLKGTQTPMSKDTIHVLHGVRAPKEKCRVLRKFTVGVEFKPTHRTEATCRLRSGDQ